MTTPSPSPRPDIAPKLSATLSRLRQRRRLRGLLTVAAVSLAVGLTCLLATRLGAQFVTLPLAGETLALLAALVTALIGLGIVALRTPGLGEVARAADADLALDERLSSALEVAADWPRESNVITAALVKDVEARTEGFDARRLVPLRSRLMTWTAAVALLAGIGALLVPASANVPTGGLPVEETGPTAPGQDGALDDAEIRQLAELVREDGEDRNNELLQAIANSIEKLADQAAAGRPAEEISDELRQLMEMAKQAYGASQPDWMPPDSNDFAALDRNLQAEEDKSNMPQPAGVTYENPYEMGYYAPQDWKGKPRDGKLPDELKNLGMSQGEGDANIDPNFGAADPNASINPNLPFEAKPLEADADIMATPAGAAADSSKGDAQMAGGGEEGISAQDLAAAEYKADSDMSIRSDKPEAEGKRIRLELPPDAQATAAGDANLGPGGRSRAETDAVSRSLVDAQARGFVARYFARKQG